MRRRDLHAPREPGICRLNRIPIHECGEELVDIRKFCRGMAIKANPSLLRRTAAEMLQRAQDMLPEGHMFRIKTALRTYETQTRGYERHLASLKEKHPEWPYSILRREANKFYHPPDQKAPPGHVTGGAVDLSIMGPDGEELDMTSTLAEGVDPNPTYTYALTPVARGNRALLIRVMTEVGFSNCADEWWHWSYGDNGWAARMGKPYAIYGAMTATEEELAAATIPEPPADGEGTPAEGEGTSAAEDGAQAGVEATDPGGGEVESAQERVPAPVAAV